MASIQTFLCVCLLCCLSQYANAGCKSKHVTTTTESEPEKIIIECEGLVQVDCRNDCTQQTCQSYLTDGGLDSSECEPRETGDDGCETTCGCEKDYKIEPSEIFGSECVANETCGCVTENEDPARYFKIDYKYKTSDGKLCKCQADHTFECVADPNPRCEVKNYCHNSCVTQGRGGCDICGVCP